MFFSSAKLEKCEPVQLTCEARYAPSFLFDDVRTISDIQKNVRKKFPISQRNPDGSLVCLNLESKSALVVGRQSISLTINQPSDYGRFKSQVSEFVPIILGKLDVDLLGRIGVRGQWIVQYASLEESSQRLLESGFSNKFQNKFLGVNSPIIQVTIPPTDSNTQTNIGLRAETHRILEIANNITKKDEIVHGVVLDIDFYDQMSDYRPDQINGFVKNLDKNFEERLIELVALLG